MQHECFKECDLIACCSTELAEMVVKKGYHPVCVVKDAVEDLKLNLLQYMRIDMISQKLFIWVWVVTVFLSRNI